MVNEIYMIKNIINNKRYIGLTRRSSHERFQEHLRKAFQSDSPTYKNRLSKEIRAHNIEAFKLGILAENVPDDELEIVEEYYIDLYNTTDLNIGLNQSPRANVTTGYESEDLSIDDNKDSQKRIKIDEIEDSAIENLLNELGES